MLVLARESERTSQEKEWKWKNRKGEFIVIRDVFGKTITWIEKIKGIGDTIVQYDPGHAALPWAAARLLLQVSVSVSIFVSISERFIGIYQRCSNQWSND